VAELPLVQIVDGLVQFLQQSQTLRRDTGLDDASVILLPLARNPAVFFHAIEKPRHVRIPRNHAFGNAAAEQAMRFRAAKDAQNIVLGRSEPGGFDQLLRFLGEPVGDFEDSDKDFILQWGGGIRSKSHTTNIVVVTTIVKRDMLNASDPLESGAQVTASKPAADEFR
jgi:hypothetical protein